MSKTYYEKLKDPRWQKKRLEILERDDFKCQTCLSSDKTLHVHHKSYYKDADPWEYPDSCFITLCEDCHKLEQDVLYSTFDAVKDLLINSKITNSSLIEIFESLHHYSENGQLLAELLSEVSLNNNIGNTIRHMSSMIYFADVNIGRENKEYHHMVNGFCSEIEEIINKYKDKIDNEYT